MSGLVAGAAAGAAVLLLAPSRPRVGGRGDATAGGPQRPAGTLVVAGVVAGGTALVLGGGGIVAVWAALGTAVLLAGRALLARRASARAAARTRERVVSVCEALASELRSGRPPATALAAAAEEWPAVAGVRRAERLGADVPTAWRALARSPGADDLRLVAAAWQVSARTGAGLAEALARVAALARATQGTRRVVASELASARATARLMAGLPVVALLMGGTTGGDPVHFLTATPVGLGCLAGGLVAGFLGLWWIEAIADDVTRSAS
ncbi:type II secretion system F family protein [Nocardioides sp. ChNu-153]|uniref:type II secretion system F family protein n=1 Tax=unclassified Nocardioides TaxID=2615069 RepID=UPI0024049543|nr:MULTISPECIES: type II secretion system F family protein [unclassified Nocardioides]MDF9715790.1 type II secretion system F family protein [Nocardioides sp. ChNu-99]MDN7121894.1 type II secretion system F family protein [Nocardioides sp. ChNu-153]